MNGVELEGRAMLVREDKMDREVSPWDNDKVSTSREFSFFFEKCSAPKSQVAYRHHSNLVFNTILYVHNHKGGRV